MEGVEELLGSAVTSSRPVGGGCISEARQVQLGDGRTVFAKSGRGLPANLLEVEAEGLRWLGSAEAVRVPQVLGLSREHQVLVLEWVDAGDDGRTARTAQRLGTGLAQLHATGAPAFGWHRDGFIGSLAQRNTPTAEDWPSFWFTRRIEPLARQATDRGSLPHGASALVDRLGAQLEALAGQPEPPARVHGDLWSGNLLVDRDGEPWLVDPAAYGGHREVDLAMLHLFGRPHADVVQAYQEVAPLASGWQDRLQLWQLEPLLVHTVLFGGSYGAQAHAVMSHFT